MNKKDDNLEKKEEITDKAFLSQRLLAFLIDVFIVSLLSSILAYPFVDSKKLDSLEKDYIEIMEKFEKQDVQMNEYVAEFINIEYAIARNNGFVTIFGVLLGLVYYVVVPLYNNGQTIGKKLLRIRVISTDGELSTNQMVFRAFLANSILLDLLSVLFLTFASRTSYFYCVGLFSMIQYTIMIVSFFMIICGRDGLAIHDRLVHTKVIRLK